MQWRSERGGVAVIREYKLGIRSQIPPLVLYFPEPFMILHNYNIRYRSIDVGFQGFSFPTPLKEMSMESKTGKVKYVHHQQNQQVEYLHVEYLVCSDRYRILQSQHYQKTS